jgi:hypothetical protein
MLIKSLFHHIISFEACKIVSNSALVVDVVTVLCLLAFQLIGPPKSCMIYPSELYLSSLSANAALLEARKAVDSPYGLNLIALYLVPYRYCMTQFMVARCSELGFVLNSNNLLTVFIASGHIIIVGYIADPTLFWYLRIICRVACPILIAYSIVLAGIVGV